MQSLILRTATQLLISLMLLFSIFILWRGHNEPGGGFIGGLIGATAFALHSLAFGYEAMRKLMVFDPRTITGVGLGCAIVAGLIAAPFSDAFLTGQWLFIGATETDKGFPLGSPLLFDIGVYLTVVGALMTIVLGLEEEDL